MFLISYKIFSKRTINNSIDKKFLLKFGLFFINICFLKKASLMQLFENKFQPDEFIENGNPTILPILRMQPFNKLEENF